MKSLLLGTIFVAACGHLGAQTAPAGSSGRIDVELLPAGQEQIRQNPIVLSFTGRSYTAAIFNNATGKLPPEMGADEAVLPKIMADNASADLSRILTNWNPTERDEISKLASDPELADANANAYKRILQSQLLVKIFYGANYVLYLVKHDRSDTSYVKDYAFKRVDGKLYLTNELTGDPVFQYVTTSYAHTLRAKKPGAAAKN